MTTPNFVWDSSVNKSILCVYDSATGLPKYVDETAAMFAVKITDGTDVLDVLVQDAAFGTASKGLGVFGKYQITPTAYTDGDAVPILLDANGRIVLSSDIQIGAVELKDSDTDGRANIKAANTARTTATLVIATQPIDGAGAVLSTSAIKTAVEVIDNFISGARGLVTEDNSASIKTAVEIIDDVVLAEDAAHVSGDKGVQALAVRKDTAAGLASLDGDYHPLEVDVNGRLHVLDQNSAAIKTAVELIDDAIAGTEMQVDVVTSALPTGAATSALQTQPGVDIGDVTVNNAAGAAAVNIQDGGNSITIDATALPLPTDAATQTTLALIKAKTDNIDVAASTLAKEATQLLQPLAATTVTLYNVTMTLANTEYSQALPANTKILEFREQSTGFVTRYAFETGKVAGSVSPFRTLGAGEVKTLDGLNLTSKTLYVACSTAGKIMEIECWS